jgi:hypothetical protein
MKGKVTCVERLFATSVLLPLQNSPSSKRDIGLMKRRRHSTGEVCETSRRGHPYSHRNSILLAAVLKMNPKLFPIANFPSEKIAPVCLAPLSKNLNCKRLIRAILGMYQAPSRSQHQYRTRLLEMRACRRCSTVLFCFLRDP